MSPSPVIEPSSSDAPPRLVAPRVAGASTYRPAHPLVQIVLARTREFYREPETIFWVYGFPVLMVLALGIAFRNQPRTTVVVAVEAGARAELLREALAGSHSSLPQGSEADVKVRVLEAEEARRQLRAGKVSLVIPSDAAFTVDNASATAAVSYLWDPTRPESALARREVDDRLQRHAGRNDPLATRDRRFDEPGSRYIDFLVPGLIGGSLMGGGLWGVGFVIVDMRVRNLLKRFITTPMRRSHFLAGLMISRFLFAVAEVLLMLLVAWLAFGVVNLGSWWAVAVFAFLGAWMFAGLGLLVASRAKTIETASGVINLAMMPMYLLSGIFFSSERFPQVVQPLIKLLPLTPLIDGLRRVMLEGAPLAELQQQLLLLLAWSVVSFWGALKLFRWS